MSKAIHLFCILLFTISFSAFTQTAQQVRDFYDSKSYDYVIEYGNNVIERRLDEYDTHLLVGRAYNYKNKFAEAIPYLERAKSLKNAPEWVTAWAHCELGFAYYAVNKKKLSSENLAACINMNATKNSRSAAMRFSWVAGLDPFYSSWKVEESPNFIFHFQDTIKRTDSFMKSHQRAFDSLTTLFNCTIPDKIDFFVWHSDSDSVAKANMRPLAYSRPEFGITHTSRSHTLGHEMMHHILHHAFPDAKTNELITEGTCVCFDFSRNNRLQKLRSMKSAKDVDVKKGWRNIHNLPPDIVYPLGGELVKRIFEKFGKEKFFLFMSDQSLENAEHIFGKELDQLIVQLESDIKE